MSVLGAISSKVDHRAPGGDLRDPGDERPEASGGQHAGWAWSIAGRKNAPANDGPDRLFITSFRTEKISFFFEKPVA
jgi:hypothetical protein